MKIENWGLEHLFHGNDIGRWVAAGAVMAAALVALFGVRCLIWRRLVRWSRATATSWDDALLGALDFPLRLLLVILAAIIALQFAPDTVRTYPAVTYGQKILFILLATWLVDRVMEVFFRLGTLPVAVTPSTRILLLTILRVILFSVGLLVVLDTAGISVTPILASLGVGSLAVALALQETLSNFFSGLYLLADKPIRIGDFVQIDENVKGYVTKIGWRSTHVQLLANNTVVIPNSKIASAKLTNYDLPEKEMAVLVEVGVAYESDLKKVEAVTIDVGKKVLSRVEGGIATFEPFIRYHTFNNSSIDFTVILRGRQFVDQYLIKHEFVKELHARYKQEGIQIPFPQRVVHLAERET